MKCVIIYQPLAASGRASTHALLSLALAPWRELWRMEIDNARTTRTYTIQHNKKHTHTRVTFHRKCEPDINRGLLLQPECVRGFVCVCACVPRHIKYTLDERRDPRATETVPRDRHGILAPVLTIVSGCWHVTSTSYHIRACACYHACYGIQQIVCSENIDTHTHTLLHTE